MRVPLERGVNDLADLAEEIMADEREKVLNDLVRSVGKYPEEAFLFVRDGLNYAVQKVHGEETKAHQVVQQYMHEHDLELGDLIAQYHAGELSDLIMHAIEAAGGADRLNRHVGGRELCWGLRDFALKRWGMMAKTVLNHWKVRSTGDFGRIVFAFIDQDLMQKQDGDTIEDFQEVYSFEEAFDSAYMPGNGFQDSLHSEEDD